MPFSGTTVPASSAPRSFSSGSGAPVYRAAHGGETRAELRI
ncbi:hypothetical protein ACFPM0_35390 [Pseudonocardia sulfidoxydans]